MRKYGLKIFFTLFIIIVVVFIGYQFILVGANKIETEIAFYSSASKTIQAHGFAVRDEIILEGNNDGVLSFTVENGTKVSKNGVIAEVYNSEADVNTKNEIDLIEKQITLLKSLNKLTISKDSTTNLETLDSKLIDETCNIIKTINSGKITEVSKNTENYVYTNSVRQIKTNKITSFDEKIQSLELKKDKLLLDFYGSKSEIKNTNSAGYFVKDIDGYENYFDFKNIKSITAQEIINAEQNKPQQLNRKQSIGKIVHSNEWYYVGIISDSASYKEKDLNVNQNITINLPLSSAEPFPAKIVSINKDTNTNQMVVVISSNYMNSDLAVVRDGIIEIQTQSYSGLKISKEALKVVTKTKETTDDKGNIISTEEKEVSGVYTIYGNEIRFKEVVILYQDDNYILCDLDPLNSQLFDKNSALKIYDEVIVKGKDLYDGKIIRSSLK